MSYILGKKVVTDTKEFESQAYGITLPIQRGNTGFFSQAFTSFEQAKSNLKNLLLTRKGERIMQPEFGSGLHSLLFEQIDSNFESNLQDVISESVNFWLPYITIKEIDVEMTDELKDKNQVNISLKFTVGNTIDTEEVTLNVQG